MTGSAASRPEDFGAEWLSLHAAQVDLRRAIAAASTEAERASLIEQLTGNRQRLAELEDRRDDDGVDEEEFDGSQAADDALDRVLRDLAPALPVDDDLGEPGPLAEDPSAVDGALDGEVGDGEVGERLDDEDGVAADDGLDGAGDDHDAAGFYAGDDHELAGFYAGDEYELAEFYAGDDHEADRFEEEPSEGFDGGGALNADDVIDDDITVEAVVPVDLRPAPVPPMPSPVPPVPPIPGPEVWPPPFGKLPVPDGAPGGQAVGGSPPAASPTGVGGEGRSRPRRRTLLLIAVLVVACFVIAWLLGWLLGSTLLGSDDGPDDATTAEIGPSEEGGASAEADFSAPGTEGDAEGLTSSVTAPQPAGGSGPLTVAVILPGRVDDLAFSQSMADGLAVVAGDRPSVDVRIDEQIDRDSVTARLEAAVDAGADLVIAHSAVFADDVVTIARDHPEVAFAVGTVDDEPSLPNVYTYAIRAEEGGYVLGAVAARLTTTDVVAAVGSVQVGTSGRYIEGFRAGVVAERPDVEVIVAFTGSLADPAASLDLTEDAVIAGADVVTGQGNELGPAMAAAADGGSLWLGNQVDQGPAAPGTVVASQVYRWEVVIDALIADLDAGILDGRALTLDLANGGLAIETNDALWPGGGLQERVDELTAAIIGGAIDPLA